jgi:hypothetical protein
MRCAARHGSPRVHRSVARLRCLTSQFGGCMPLCRHPPRAPRSAQLGGLPTFGCRPRIDAVPPIPAACAHHSTRVMAGRPTSTVTRITWGQRGCTVTLRWAWWIRIAGCEPLCRGQFGFPTGGANNPTLTIVALWLRGQDRDFERLGQQQIAPSIGNGRSKRPVTTR